MIVLFVTVSEPTWNTIFFKSVALLSTIEARDYKRPFYLCYHSHTLNTTYLWEEYKEPWSSHKTERIYLIISLTADTDCWAGPYRALIHHKENEREVVLSLFPLQPIETDRVRFFIQSLEQWGKLFCPLSCIPERQVGKKGCAQFQSTISTVSAEWVREVQYSVLKSP